MRSIVRVALTLFGVSLITGGLGSLAATDLYHVLPDGELFSMLPVFGFTIVAVSVIAFVPGAFLILKSQSLAERIAPDAASDAGQLGAYRAYHLGLCLLGIYFAIGGASTCVAAVAGLVAWLTTDVGAQFLGLVAAGPFELLAGIWLYRTGKQQLATAAGGP